MRFLLPVEGGSARNVSQPPTALISSWIIGGLPYMATTDPDCESDAYAEECERPFADEIGFGSGYVLRKRRHARLRGVTDKICTMMRTSESGRWLWLDVLGKESPATGGPDAGLRTTSLASTSVVEAVWHGAAG
jgi:hypothetical protein